MSSAVSIQHLQTLREDAQAIFRTGVNAADPYLAVKSCLRSGPHHLEILDPSGAGRRHRSGRWTKVHVIAFGKAACSMAAAAQESIPPHMLAPHCLAVTNYENVVPVDGFEVLGAGHPLPDAAGLDAAIKVAALAPQVGSDDLLLTLVSGGGSALLPYPVTPVTLDDKITVTELLLACGATIHEINCVRKHLSRLKGGGLARKTASADSHTLFLSDVLDDDLSAIASGPTVPDATTFQDAIAILQAKAIWELAPAAVRKVLEAGTRKDIPETPKPGDPLFARSGHTLVGSNRLSIEAMLTAAQQQGYQSHLYSDHICGEARRVAGQLARHAKQLFDRGIDQPQAILGGGETTVTLQGNGTGGRNQEMALAFALAAEELDLPPYWAFLSGGTDGRDGPTIAAGGVVDPHTLQRIRHSHLDPQALLGNNDSHAALTCANDLLLTGATGTNVADLQVALLYHPNKP